MSKVLFVIHEIGIGGSRTSLLNLLELLNRCGYRADLFIMEHGGVFMDRAAACANILPENTKLASIVCNRNNIKKYGIKGFVNRCIFLLKCNIRSHTIVINDVYRTAAELIEEYDIAVAYQEDSATDFVKYIKAKKRIAWIHTMYERFTVNRSHQEILETYSAFSNIVSVAPAAVNAIKNGLPELKERVCLIPNLINTEMIKKAALLNQYEITDDVENVIISVGRLAPEKQYDFAIRAAKRLAKEGYSFRWYIVGDGGEKGKLQAMIEEENLVDNVFLLGARENPYPLIYRADVLVISSLYEAQPMVANEALVLGVPVITTDYLTSKTLIKNGQDGIICETSVDGIYNAVKKFISNKTLSKNLTKGAKNFLYDNNSIFNKILDLLCL